MIDLNFKLMKKVNIDGLSTKALKQQLTIIQAELDKREKNNIERHKNKIISKSPDTDDINYFSDMCFFD